MCKIASLIARNSSSGWEYEILEIVNNEDFELTLEITDC